MAYDFTGKVIVVTGAGGNIGQAVARHFGAAGATLVLVGRKTSELAFLEQELNATVCIADVTDPISVGEMVDQIENKHGEIHVLVHTVGGFSAGHAVHDGDLDVWDKMMTINARSVYVTCGRVARHMLDHQVKGRIIAVLSKNAYQGTAKTAAYSASKAAAQRILESMSAELANDGITVNGIAPSSVDTPQNRAAMPNVDFSKWVRPEEIADAALFLAADSSRSVTGITLDVSGRG